MSRDTQAHINDTQAHMKQETASTPPFPPYTRMYLAADAGGLVGGRPVRDLERCEVLLCDVPAVCVCLLCKVNVHHIKRYVWYCCTVYHI